MSKPTPKPKLEAKPEPKAKFPWDEIKPILDNAAITIVSIMTNGLIFAAIWGVAVCLGWGMHWTHETFPSTPEYAYVVGHFVEGTLYVVDCALLLRAVLEHLWHCFRKPK